MRCGIKRIPLDGGGIVGKLCSETIDTSPKLTTESSFDLGHNLSIEWLLSVVIAALIGADRTETITNLSVSASPVHGRIVGPWTAQFKPAVIHASDRAKSCCSREKKVTAAVPTKT
jgi:hypothetical protein